MFKPIKDFLTFIQKNTSINDADTEIIEESNVMDNLQIHDKSDITEVSLSTSVGKTENDIEALKGCLVTTSTAMASDFDEDDIELQIKSSIMLKHPPLKSSTSSPTQTTTSSECTISSPSSLSTTLVATCSKSFLADYNQNLQQKVHHCAPEDDDELSDFKNEPLKASYEDFHSVNSELEEPQVHSADEEALDESRTEEEDDLEDEICTNDAAKREIFVVIENDVNSSIASSSVDDPLAIDIAALPMSSDEACNPLDSSTNEENDELSSISGINWFDTEDKPVTNISDMALPSIEISRISSITTAQQSKGENRENDSINSSRNEERTEEMERCDNSDSGLGTETSSLLLQTTINNSITDSSNYQECNQVKALNVVDGGVIERATSSTTTILANTTTPLRKPFRSNLKRRFCDDTDVETSSLPGSSIVKSQDLYSSKKPKRSINFDAVQVYYFPRQQGFGCVPSAGGCTLGMGTQHVDFKRLTLAEHAAELRRAHRLQLQEVNPRGSSSEETDESEEDYLSDGSGSDLDADSNGFLQPVPPKQRRAILKAAGVRKIDTSEKVECRNIRNSREVCGCTCRDFCDPETCSCSQAGIKCQVDRAMFPCGCSRDACGNTTGRVEFNPARVRTHFIHTIMRLDMENRQQQQPISMSTVRSSCSYDSTVSSSSVATHTITDGATISNHNGYYSMQTQSNYSSGYASPAYPNEHSSLYYQQQSVTFTNTNDGTSSATPYHSLDSVDGGVFSSSTTNAVPSYGEILPNYCPNNSTGALEFTNTEYHSSMTYTPTYLSYQSNQTHVANSTYLTPQHGTSNNNNDIVENVESSYSSSTVTSQQSYDAVTTRTLSTTTLTTNDNNFISLSTPTGSSSRLSQINDLLQHNRNTTAALVAVSQHSGVENQSTATSCADKNSNLKSSIEMPHNNENQKSCLVFGSDLARAPINPISEKQPTPPSEPPPIDYDSRVAVADYTI